MLVTLTGKTFFEIGWYDQVQEGDDQWDIVKQFKTKRRGRGTSHVADLSLEDFRHVLSVVSDYYELSDPRFSDTPSDVRAALKRDTERLKKTLENVVTEEDFLKDSNDCTDCYGYGNHPDTYICPKHEEMASMVVNPSW